VQLDLVLTNTQIKRDTKFKLKADTFDHSLETSSFSIWKKQLMTVLDDDRQKYFNGVPCMCPNSH
jgi:hypothetical protein